MCEPATWTVLPHLLEAIEWQHSKQHGEFISLNALSLAWLQGVSPSAT